MPKLENLKKQAELLLQRHREQHYPVAVQIRGHLPRFLDISDSEILAASFRLGYTQEVVTRQQGFDNWQALKTSFSQTPPNTKPAPSKSSYCRAKPQLLFFSFSPPASLFTRG